MRQVPPARWRVCVVDSDLQDLSRPALVASKLRVTEHCRGHILPNPSWPVTVHSVSEKTEVTERERGEEVQVRVGFDGSRVDSE